MTDYSVFQRLGNFYSEIDRDLTEDEAEDLAEHYNDEMGTLPTENCGYVVVRTPPLPYPVDDYWPEPTSFS